MLTRATYLEESAMTSQPRQPLPPLKPFQPLRQLWQSSAPLTAVGLVMFAAFLVSCVGLVLDPRVIAGAPAWLKPAKFGISTAIYALTLAWVFTYLPSWTKTVRAVGWMTAVIFVFEVGIIDLQAWRGTTSHFNVATPFDATLFALMGLGIVLQTLGSVLVAAALWRQRFDDTVMGWALRAGMTITIVGAATGGLMTRPTDAQLVQLRATHRAAVVGAHTVGAPDGGPGLPATGWSREHGDLRAPHFVGLHALQALAVAGLLVGRRRGQGAQGVNLMRTAAASYAALFAILVWQALRGQSLVRPDELTLAVLASWAALTSLIAWVTASRQVSARPLEVRT
jgi:hypothetical protein